MGPLPRCLSGVGDFLHAHFIGIIIAETGANIPNDRRDLLGKDHVYLTRFGKPLDQACPVMQDDLLGLEDPDADSCDEGYCWT